MINLGSYSEPEDGQAKLAEMIQNAKELLPLCTMIQELGDWERVRENRCPFHTDYSPSFSIFEHDGEELWKCHGRCDMAGDHITYLEKKYSITRGQAIRMFLSMAGIGNPGGGRFKK